MNHFLKKIINGSGVTPPDGCLISFKANFADAINVEWLRRDDYYEVTFYRNNLEYIALFNTDGSLLEYRQNLPLDLMPESIKNIALSKGEIMNSVLKNKGNKLEYELILRDQLLNRTLVVLSEIGDIVEDKKL